ncbi:MAG: divalent-cation tolerance protein CutA [Chromatiales bacterium]|nr:divalent-cation tolerance protein CutA [Gammaproteobacteria bacterium]MCP5353165.1 divalent-cation tolerance protein CutA [Chromatiales bacterium]
MSDLPLIVYCTCPNHETARRIAALAVDAGVAACVNVLPGITSFYRWKGKLQQDEETLLLIKTRQTVYPKLEALVQQHHPYELPELVAVPITVGLPGYLAWIVQATGAQPAVNKEENA